MKIYYQHYKNKKYYEIIDYCLIQENNKWIEAVMYTESGRIKKFCRSLEEFNSKFKVVE
jgi:hypothetical protein